ncbi:MAG: hypothetical protein WAK78_06675, partial [Candidatus Acidiferrales bacterium]
DAPLHRGLAAWDAMTREGIEQGNSRTRGRFTRERNGAARWLFWGFRAGLGLCRAYGARPAFRVFPSAYALG